MTTRTAAAEVAITIALLGTALCVSPGADAQARPVLARVEAKTSSAKARVPRSFLGLSVEFDIVARRVALLHAPDQANPVFVALLKRLGAYGGGMPTLRIGGSSTDSTYMVNGKNQEQPLGTNVAINGKWLRAVRAFALASASPLIVGVNLAIKRSDIAARFAKLIVGVMPKGSVRALEIGNEPDIYSRRPLYPGRSTRSKKYGPKDYIRELRSYTKAVHAATPKTTLAGPAMIVDYRWESQLKAIMRSARQRVRLMTLHRYPLQTCGGKRVTIADLLSPKSLDGHYGPVARFAAIGRHYHQRLRLTETNSVACGGRAGVSDSFASALWGTDWLFMLATIGLDGVDFHTASNEYTPFRLVDLGAGRRGALVQPLYYAMQVFAEATAHRARILTSTAGAARRSPRSVRGRIHAWATYDGVDRVVRVVIDNKSRKAGDVLIHVPGALGNGTLKRLEARSVSSKTGVTWGGQTFAEPTFDGQLVGAPVVHTAHVSHARFRVRMPKTGIAMLTVRVRRR